MSADSIEDQEADIAPRRAKPVKWGAALGIMIIAIEAYVLADWIMTGYAKPLPAGTTPTPDWMGVVSHALGLVGVVPFVLFVYYFLIRQWRRAGHITTDNAPPSEAPPPKPEAAGPPLGATHVH
ncbi:MAG: hypothetical protein WB785_20950 [Mycobacterium sp.]|uniref:hypothetical protein n=1 Tax=Mycobacterium sp. TaxID=1785 RepID=UPI003C5D01EB